MNGDSNMSKGKHQAILKIAVATFMWGTVGIFRRNIALPSGLLAMLRGIIGTAFLAIFRLIKTRNIHITAGRKKGKLILSGALIGFDWVLLFEAFNYTSVAVATMCYYMQPIIVALASPYVTKTKLTRRQLICALVAIFGMVLVSDVLNTGIKAPSEIKGILLGLGTAVLYAIVIFMNQDFSDIEASDKTILQLLSASVCIFPYVLIKDHPFSITYTSSDIINTLLLGIFVTGLAYSLYFDAMKFLSALETASFSYIDPVTALFFSALFLNEKMTIVQGLGATLILVSTLVSQLSSAKNTSKN